MNRKLFGVDTKKVGVDAGYAGNANLELYRMKEIQTSFAKKGRRILVEKEDDVIRKELTRVRTTRMEGSFGTQREHYGLKRIKARRRDLPRSCASFSAYTRRTWSSLSGEKPPKLSRSPDVPHEELDLYGCIGSSCG